MCRLRLPFTLDHYAGHVSGSSLWVDHGFPGRETRLTTEGWGLDLGVSQAMLHSVSAMELRALPLTRSQGASGKAQPHVCMCSPCVIVVLGTLPLHPCLGLALVPRAQCVGEDDGAHSL